MRIHKTVSRTPGAELLPHVKILWQCDGYITLGSTLMLFPQTLATFLALLLLVTFFKLND